MSRFKLWGFTIAALCVIAGVLVVLRMGPLSRDAVFGRSAVEYAKSSLPVIFKSLQRGSTEEAIARMSKSQLAQWKQGELPIWCEVWNRELGGFIEVRDFRFLGAAPSFEAGGPRNYIVGCIATFETGSREEVVYLVREGAEWRIEGLFIGNPLGEKR